MASQPAMVYLFVRICGATKVVHSGECVARRSGSENTDAKVMSANMGVHLGQMGAGSRQIGTGGDRSGQSGSQTCLLLDWLLLQRANRCATPDSDGRGSWDEARVCAGCTGKVMVVCWCKITRQACVRRTLYICTNDRIVSWPWGAPVSSFATSASSASCSNSEVLSTLSSPPGGGTPGGRGTPWWHWQPRSSWMLSRRVSRRAAAGHGRFAQACAKPPAAKLVQRMKGTPCEGFCSSRQCDDFIRSAFA